MFCHGFCREYATVCVLGTALWFGGYGAGAGTDGAAMVYMPHAFAHKDCEPATNFFRDIFPIQLNNVVLNHANVVQNLAEVHGAGIRLPKPSTSIHCAPAVPICAHRKTPHPYPHVSFQYRAHSSLLLKLDESLKHGKH